MLNIKKCLHLLLLSNVVSVFTTIFFKKMPKTLTKEYFFLVWWNLNYCSHNLYPIAQ
jgi:hypothetical protein